MAADKTKNILNLEQRTSQMRALQLIDYSSKFLDLIEHPRIEGGKAYYIANITNEPTKDDKIGILPNEIKPSTAIQQTVELNKIKVFRDVINEEIMSLSLERVKEFTEDITAGMFAKFSHILDGEIVDVLTTQTNYHSEALNGENKDLFEKWDEKSDKTSLVNKILTNIDFLLNPSEENNKGKVLANSKDESSIIWLVDTSIYNGIRRRYLTLMANPEYGDFLANLRGVIRWPNLPNGAKWGFFDYRAIAAPYNIKDYSEWYYGLDKCTYLRLKVSYGLEMLESVPACLTFQNP